MKVLAILALSILSYAPPSFAKEFEGNWKIDKFDCLDQSTFKPANYPGWGFLPYVSCRDMHAKVEVTFTENPKNLNVAFFDSYGGSYDHRQFHCYPTSVHNFSEGFCTGFNYYREGELKVAPDESKISYSEFKPNSGFGNSYSYSFVLEKIGANKYKLN